jgi:hypothetical protein
MNVDSTFQIAISISGCEMGYAQAVHNAEAEIVMQRSQSATQTDSNVAMITRAALWTWFACGVIALMLFPELRGRAQFVGWLPFWLVIAPLIDLAIMRREWLAATSRVFLVRARRRRRAVPRQAQRLRHRRAVRSVGSVVSRKGPV